MLWMSCFVLAAILILINIAFTKKERSAKTILGIINLYLLVMMAGVVCIFAAWAHIFRADEIARMIGWPTGSPFQFEVAMMNLALGVLGVLCIWFRGDFWLATAINMSVLFLGCAYGHLRSAIVSHDYAPYNAGLGIWFYDVIIPILILTLVIVHRSIRER